MTLLLRIEDDRLSCRRVGDGPTVVRAAQGLLGRSGAPTTAAEALLGPAITEAGGAGAEVLLVLPARAVHARKLACTVPVAGRVAQADVTRAIDALKEEGASLHAASLFHGVCRVACDETEVSADPVGTTCRRLLVESISLTADLSLLRRYERVIAAAGGVLTDVISPHRIAAELGGAGTHIHVWDRETMIVVEGDRGLVSAGTVPIGAAHLRRDAALAAPGTTHIDDQDPAVARALEARLAEWAERLEPLLPPGDSPLRVSGAEGTGRHFAAVLGSRAVVERGAPDLFDGAERLLASGRHERARWTPKSPRPGAAWVAWLREHF